MGIIHSKARGNFLPWAAWRAVFVAWAALLGVASASASNLNVTVDGSQTFQVIDGFGVNANHRSFTNNEITPVLDALIDQAGMTLFRVVYDNADWEQTNDNDDPNVMNWDYYSAIYSGPEFQQMWNMMAYLNQRGITNGLMPNFQGFAPPWMGGRTLAPGYEDEWAEMIASALIYARKTNNLQFTLVGPNNEPDLLGSGVVVTNGQQYALTLHKLSDQLDANGLSDLRFVGPDLSSSGTNWLSDIMADPVVMSKLAHFGLHSYSEDGGWSVGVSDFLQQSAYPDRNFWMTEFNVWCEACEDSVSGTNTWIYARTAAEYLLDHLANNASAGLAWEAYDSIYRNNYNDDLHWSFWGLFAVNNTNATPRTYTPRKIFYTLSQISKFVRPGAKRIAVGGTDGTMMLLGFYQPDTQQLTLTGINYNSKAAPLSASFANLPGIASLDLYYTSATANLTHGTKVAVTNGVFAATIPADSVFTLTGFVPATIAILTQPTNQLVKTGGTAVFSVQATGSAPLSYQWQRNKANIAGATNSSVTVTNVKPLNARDAGTYCVVITSTATSLTSSNAVLLVDQRNPVVSITSPKAGARLTNGVVTVAGKATDDTQVAAVFYQLNGSSWTSATGTSNWSANVNLTAGSNVFRAYAMDPVGNNSTTGSLAVTFVVDVPLTLITNGLGGITGATNGASLEIGKMYTLTAIPKAGQVFSNWVGTVSSANTALSFVMQSNMVVQANFIPNPFLPAVGTYNGLFYQTNRVQAQSGFLTLTLTSAGSYTARLQVGTASYSTSGKLTVAGIALQNVTRPGTTPLTLTITLDLAGAQSLSGTVTDGKWVADLMAERVVFDAKTNPATQFLGKYNFVIPGGDNTGTAFPEGDGYGTALVDASGKVTLGGSLADGTGLTQMLPVSGSGDWALYVPLYGGGGSLLGWLNFDTNQPAAGLQGWLSWIKPAQRTTYYPGGFTNAIFASGSRYTAPPGNTNQAIPLTNGVLSLNGGNFTMPLTNLVFLSTSNKISDGSLSNKLSLSLTVSNGVFKGSITPAGTSRALSIQGVLLQDLGAGYGYFLGTNQAGQVYFGP